MDRIFIRDLLVRGVIGVNDEERRERQDILVNVDMWADTRPAGASDDLARSVNYRSVAKRLIAHVETAQPLLVEKLAADLAGIVLAEFAVERVRVRVEKPGALRVARSVGIEIERTASAHGGAGA